MDKTPGKGRSNTSPEPTSSRDLAKAPPTSAQADDQSWRGDDFEPTMAVDPSNSTVEGRVNNSAGQTGASASADPTAADQTAEQALLDRLDQLPAALQPEDQSNLGSELRGELRIPIRKPQSTTSPSSLVRTRPRAMETAAVTGETAADPKVSINFLLFINLRNHSSALVTDIRSTLTDLQEDGQFELEITQVREHPQLAEHFKLVATPSLVKTHPLPAQVLTGSNVTEQLRYWWPRWISEAKLLRSNEGQVEDPELDLKGLPTDISEYIFGLEDEAFRLRQEKESLQAQLRFRDRIISILAHDLRNPLMGASLAVETLGKGLSQETPLPDGLDLQLVKQAKGQLKVLDNLVADMLQPDWGQERLTIEPQRCDLAELRSTVIQQFEEQIAAKGQSLQVDIPLDLPPACADTERIRQVFANLLDNAIKYTPHGGKIMISAFHRTSQKLEISVCDTGPGIPVEDQGRIFENTVRLDRDQGTPGYGIGLALCDRIIKAHFCRIWVDSRMPEGSCFRFTLPVFDE